MTTKAFKATEVTEVDGMSLKIVMTGEGGPCSTVLSKYNVSAVHSNGKTLHVQSGDHFMEIDMKSASEAIQCARFLMGEELEQPINQLPRQDFGGETKKADDVAALAKELLLKGEEPLDAWNKAREFYEIGKQR